MDMEKPVPLLLVEWFLGLTARKQAMLSVSSQQPEYLQEFMLT